MDAQPEQASADEKTIWEGHPSQRDYTLVEPFFLRMFGLCHIVLTTDDNTDTTKTLQAVPNIQWLRDQIRKQVEACRIRKGVRIAKIG